MTDARYYQQSGYIGTRGPVTMALAAVGAAIVCGAIFGYWMYYLYALVTFWVPPVYGALVGVAVGMAAHHGKVRSDLFVGLCGLAAGVLAIYTGWVFWLLAWSGHDYFSTFSDYSMPSALAEAARDGVDYFDEFTATGGVLYFWWTIEALLIVLGAGAGAYALVDQGVNTFCDAYDEWAENVYRSPELEGIPDEEGFTSELEAEPLARLSRMQAVEPVVPGRTSRLSIQACTRCWNFVCLDVQRIERTKNAKGETKSDETLLVDNLLVDKALHDGLVDRFGPSTATSG